MADSEKDPHPTPEPEVTPVKEPPESQGLPVAEPSVPPKERLEPTRYGDWELNGKCVDF